LAFRGHFDQTLDEKNRLNVPARFRAAFAGGVVVVKWIEPCVAVFTPEGFEAATEEMVGGLNPADRRRRNVLRFFAGNSWDVGIDSGGRVTLNQPLLDHAGIGREITVVGSVDHLEVWDRERWTEHEQELSAGIADLAESLGNPS
jgi:MraZ protein